jgi:uncharacterized protein (TIGR03083 family)
MTIDYTSHLRSDGELMALGAARDMDAHVPTCPEWNVGKLVTHTGSHHRWVGNAVRGGGKAPEDPARPGLRGAELLEWFRKGWGELAELLDASDDETPAWSWSGDNRIGFWRRRTALETLVHRWDAENATGATSPLDPELSADGIDEMLFVMMPQGNELYPGESAVVSLHTTDHDRSWRLELTNGATARSYRDDIGGATIVIEGKAEDVLLYLWGRRKADSVEIRGDGPPLESFKRWVEE